MPLHRWSRGNPSTARETEWHAAPHPQGAERAGRPTSSRASSRQPRLHLEHPGEAQGDQRLQRRIVDLAVDAKDHRNDGADDHHHCHARPLDLRARGRRGHRPQWHRGRWGARRNVGCRFLRCQAGPHERCRVRHVDVLDRPGTDRGHHRPPRTNARGAWSGSMRSRASTPSTTACGCRRPTTPIGSRLRAQHFAVHFLTQRGPRHRRAVRNRAPATTPTSSPASTSITTRTAYRCCEPVRTG